MPRIGLTRLLAGLLALLILISCDIKKASNTSNVSTTDFLKQTEETLRKEQYKTYLAEWVHSNFITEDTTYLASQALANLTEISTRYAIESKKHSSKDKVEQRKLDQMLLMLTIPGPSDPRENEELAELKAKLESTYGSGKVCEGEGKCQDLQDLSDIIDKSRNPDELLKAWEAWRTVSVPMADDYRRTVQLGNKGAVQLGFTDMGELWKAKYDMTSSEFAQLMDETWNEVKPFYEQLHCYARAQLNKKYGDDVVDKEGMIPAHLLGNMWAQQWGNIADLMDTGDGARVDLTSLLEKHKYDSKKMVKTAENFFVSLGMPELPKTFYDRSLFVKPQDRDVVCHASAWHMDAKDDVRIKMCIKIDDEDFRTIHHELGHIYYYLAYMDQPMVFQGSANDGFHEALGDTLELSITPKYLQKINLLEENAPKVDEITYLMKMALNKIAFLPFGLLVDKWRWQVFSGEIKPTDYNKAWWALRHTYQGIKEPRERPANAFDPGAKYHIPGYTPYSRYFLATILQFQFHKGLCAAAGHQGPLHECTIFGSKEAGNKIWAMMKLGASKPWPEALEVVTGSAKMDAGAIREYFAPLEEWLKKKNKDRKCGWN